MGKPWASTRAAAASGEHEKVRYWECDGGAGIHQDEHVLLLWHRGCALFGL